MSQTFSSLREERSVWLILAGLWAASGVVAWLLSLAGRGQALSGDTLTALAVLIAGVGVVLRLPILTEARQPEMHPPSELVDHLILMLCYVATFNWLGHLLLRSTSLFATFPSLLVLIGSEIWVHHQFFSVRCLTWLKFAWWSGKSRTATMVRWLRATSAQPNSRQASSPAQPSPASPAPLTTEGGLSEVESADSSDLLVRQTSETIDEQGRRCLSGEIQSNFSSQQSIQEIPVGFCPAFEGTPEVDFESSDAEVQLRLTACSPQGMRLVARRTPRDQPVAFSVEWYASQVVDQPPPQASQTLP